MWTVENRVSYDRGGLRYPSDVTDDEWAHIAPLIPPAKRGGRKRNVDVRDVVNGLMYILSTGCQWRAIPKDLPPRSTLFGYFELWDYVSMAGENCTVLAIENFSLGACGRTPSRGVGGVALDGAVDKRVVSIATENFSFL